MVGVAAALVVGPVTRGRRSMPAPISARSHDWPVRGGDPGNSRYSPLDQINRGNVGRLQVAWTYHTGDTAPGQHSEIQATPIVVDGVLYTTTPALAVVALRADRGTVLWNFQTVHHDLWDRDLPAAPTLLTVQHDGRPVDAVAQTTKSGFVFLVDRVTGVPLFPVEERPVPASDLPGERGALCERERRPRDCHDDAPNTGHRGRADACGKRGVCTDVRRLPRREPARGWRSRAVARRRWAAALSGADPPRHRARSWLHASVRNIAQR